MIEVAAAVAVQGPEMFHLPVVVQVVAVRIVKPFDGDCGPPGGLQNAVRSAEYDFIDPGLALSRCPVEHAPAAVLIHKFSAGRQGGGRKLGHRAIGVTGFNNERGLFAFGHGFIGDILQHRRCGHSRCIVEFKGVSSGRIHIKQVEEIFPGIIFYPGFGQPGISGFDDLTVGSHDLFEGFLSAKGIG